MGLFGDLAKGAAQSLQERANNVSEKKAEYERRLEYASDEEIFRTISRKSATSADFAALSLILQDRGYSSDEVSQKYREMKHNR